MLRRSQQAAGLPQAGTAAAAGAGSEGLHVRRGRVYGGIRTGRAQNVHMSF